MLYKEYGKTGKKISAIGFGGMRFKKDEYEKDIELCAQLLREANAVGINYFDTAPGYCDDKSEEIFGAAFKSMPNDFYVSTKCGLWNAKDENGARKMIEQSLKRLGVNKINFYNAWCIKNLDEYKEFIKKGGIYDGIVKAKQEGLIEHVCCTSHASGKDIEQIASDGLFEGITLNYNAINFLYRHEGVKACHNAGMGVVVMNPLGGGIIPSNPDYFSFIKGDSDQSVIVEALKFLTSQKEITAALCGFSTLSEISENIKATQNVTPLTDEAFERLSKHITTGLNSLCTGCSYCDECPVDVDIPKLLNSYNAKILSGKMNGVISSLKYFWNLDPQNASKCIECGKCEALCTQKLPIIERLKEISSYKE